MKNMMREHWETPETPTPTSFTIPDADKEVVRNSMVDALVHASSLIRSQLAQSLEPVIRTDYPHNWPTLHPALSAALTTQNGAENGVWMAALSVLHAIMKHYEYATLPLLRSTSNTSISTSNTSTLVPVINGKRVLSDTRNSKTARCS